MKEQKFNYSFIIPHKNCPGLLQRCVDSIPERDDVQVIVVDDNSDEGKKPSLKERKNLQVILLDKTQSKGAGRARNVGLKHATGKWLLFADADDYFSENLPDLLEKYKTDSSTDIVYLNASKFDENGAFSCLFESQLIDAYFDNKKNAERRLRYGAWTPWFRMVKRTIVIQNHIRFDEIPAANDKMFGLLCSKFSKTIKAEKKFIYYYYRPSFNSQTDNKRNSLMFDEMLDLRCRTIALYEEVYFRPVPSVLGLFRSFGIIKNNGYKKWFSRYSKTLRKHHIPIYRDLIRFFQECF